VLPGKEKEREEESIEPPLGGIGATSEKQRLKKVETLFVKVKDEITKRE